MNLIMSALALNGCLLTGVGGTDETVSEHPMRSEHDGLLICLGAWGVGTWGGGVGGAGVVGAVMCWLFYSILPCRRAKLQAVAVER